MSDSIAAPVAPAKSWKETVVCDPEKLELAMKRKPMTGSSMGWEARKLAEAFWPDCPKNATLEEAIREIKKVCNR